MELCQHPGGGARPAALPTLPPAGQARLYVDALFVERGSPRCALPARGAGSAQASPLRTPWRRPSLSCIGLAPGCPPKRWRPRRLASAPASIDTVAAAPPGANPVQDGQGRRHGVRKGEAGAASRRSKRWRPRRLASAPVSIDTVAAAPPGDNPMQDGQGRRHGVRKGEAGAASRRPKRWRPRRLASAPASIDTVAAFRPWRDFRSSVARGRRGHHRCGSRGAIPGSGGAGPPAAATAHAGREF